MSTSKIMAASLVAGIAFASQVDAAIVTYAATLYDTTEQNRWRDAGVAKSLDLDGDNVYGSDGYAIFGAGQPAYYQDFTDPLAASGTQVTMPTGMTLSRGWLTPFATIADTWYPAIQDPSNPGVDVTLGMAGRSIGSSETTTEDGQQWVFGIGSDFEGAGTAGSSFRLGVMIWNPTNQFYGSGPATMRLISGASDTGDVVNQTGDWGQAVMYFDVTDYNEGDSIELWLGSNRPGNQAGNGAFIQGLTIDVNPIPAPSSAAMMVAGLSMLLGRRRNG